MHQTNSLHSSVEQVEAIPQDKTVSVVGLFFIFLAGIMLAPLFPNQFISGPMVNAILFIVTVMLGLRSGLIFSFVPSVIALIGGLLPVFLVPFIPFIMLSNIIMVSVFHNLRLKNIKLAIVVSAILKFIFLAVASKLFFEFFLNSTMSQTIAYMMSWNQLYSALLGGIIAYTFLKIIKRI